MARPYIKGGTPTGSVPLCRTCTNAHIMTGYRESEQITICTDVNPNIVMPFIVNDCTGYYDKNRPSWSQMEDLAIEVRPAPTLKPVGFRTGIGFAIEREDLDMDEREPEQVEPLLDTDEQPAAFDNIRGRLL